MAPTELQRQSEVIGALRAGAWYERARCRVEHADFFPHDSVGVAAARRICAGCPVRALCLEFALVNHIRHGIWGGTSERARERLARSRRRAPGAQPDAAE